MWHKISDEHRTDKETTAKWVKVDPQNKIVGRVAEVDGEFHAIGMVFDAEGVGKRISKGWYLTLVSAQAAVDTPPQVVPQVAQ